MTILTAPDVASVALALAPVPPPPVMVTRGGEVYPEPGIVTVMPVTLPPATHAIAAAPVPPPPVMVTVGGETYPLPLFTTEMLATPKPSVAEAVAVVPGPGIGGSMVTIGAEV